MGTEDKKVKSVLGTLAWLFVTLPLIYGFLSAAYYDFAAYHLGYSLRAPSRYRINLAGTSALIGGLSSLTIAAAFILMAFPRTRRFWFVSVLLIVAGFVIYNYVALPLRFQKT